jgi:hypothetical protein
VHDTRPDRDSWLAKCLDRRQFRWTPPAHQPTSVAASYVKSLTLPRFSGPSGSTIINLAERSSTRRAKDESERNFLVNGEDGGSTIYKSWCTMLVAAEAIGCWALGGLAEAGVNVRDVMGEVMS